MSSFCPVGQSANAPGGHDQARLKPGLPGGWQGLSIIHCPPRGHISRKLDPKWRSPDVNKVLSCGR